jgi:superfamily II DNA or RNA helicase
VSQGNLFLPRPAIQEPVSTDPWRGLRYYQSEACEAVEAGWEDARSQLLVMATGTGKTIVFGAIARAWLAAERGPVLVLANRNELVQQGREHLERMCGVPCDVDQAGDLAPRKAKLVMASIDTVKQQHRLDRYGKDHFSLIICDEAHHWADNTYMRPLDFFADAKVLGVTATPDRADEKALGKTFDSVAYCFDILQGIEAGYLVPIEGKQVELQEIQLDGIKTVAGDLAKGQLDEVMVRAVEGIVHKTLELERHRQAIGFFPGIKSAQYACERFNALEPDSTGFIHGGTDENIRNRITADYKSGKLRRLMNVGIAIEGFDAPATSLIIQGRPTKSRMFYAQTVGRGTRVLPGTVDHIDGRDGAERRSAVATSLKPTCLVMDFVGNATKHALITPEDLLGGDYSDEEVDLAKKKSKQNPGGDVRKRLEEARRELAAVAAAIRSKVSANVRSFNPFAVLDIDLASTTREDMRWGRLPPTEKQLEALVKMKVPDAAIKQMSQRQARQLLSERNKRHDAGLATYAQLAQLKRYGLDDKSISFANAGRALTYVAQECGWGKTAPVNVEHLSWVARGGK